MNTAAQVCLSHLDGLRLDCTLPCPLSPLPTLSEGPQGAQSDLASLPLSPLSPSLPSLSLPPLSIPSLPSPPLSHSLSLNPSCLSHSPLSISLSFPSIPPLSLTHTHTHTFPLCFFCPLSHFPSDQAMLGQEAEAIAAVEAIAAADMAQAALLPVHGAPPLAPMDAMALLPATVARLTGEMPVSTEPQAGPGPLQGASPEPAVHSSPPVASPLTRAITAPAALLREAAKEEAAMAGQGTWPRGAGALPQEGSSDGPDGVAGPRGPALASKGEAARFAGGGSLEEGRNVGEPAGPEKIAMPMQEASVGPSGPGRPAGEAEGAEGGLAPSDSDSATVSGEGERVEGGLLAKIITKVGKGEQPEGAAGLKIKTKGEVGEGKEAAGRRKAGKAEEAGVVAPAPISMPFWGRIANAATTTDTMLRFLNNSRRWCVFPCPLHSSQVVRFLVSHCNP